MDEKILISNYGENNDLRLDTKIADNAYTYASHIYIYAMCIYKYTYIYFFYVHVTRLGAVDMTLGACKPNRHHDRNR